MPAAIYKIFKILLALTFLMTAACAGTKAIIIDASSLQTQVHKFSLIRGKNKLQILEGEGVRVIPVERISWIKISSKEINNRSGTTYYLTELELRDGTKIMTYRLKDGQKSRAFVCVDDTINAQTLSGPIKVELSRVSKITFEQ